MIHDLIEVLPHLDCGQCGYRGCRPYAQALTEGVAAVDRCVPGGLAVLRSLGGVLGIDPEPYEEDMRARASAPKRAQIESQSCIGCYKCVEVCPVDAILGAHGLMHEIIESECHGCALCVKACPVDCIAWVEAPEETALRYELRGHYALRAQSKEKQQEQSRHAATFWGKQRRQAYIEQASMRKKTHGSDAVDHRTS